MSSSSLLFIPALEVLPSAARHQKKEDEEEQEEGGGGKYRPGRKK